MEKKAVQTGKKKPEKAGKNIVGARGRIFYGVVSKIFDKRAVIEFQRTVRIPKYERFTKKSTKLHARIPEGFNLKVGDYVKIRECRPLSKMIHFVVLEVLKNIEETVK